MRATFEKGLHKNNQARQAIATTAREHVTAELADFEFCASGSPSALCHRQLDEFEVYSRRPV